MQEESILTTVFLPASLFIIMLGMGLSLTVGDFKRIFTSPRAVLVGLTNQLILLPIVGYLIVIVFGVDKVTAVGLILLCACPGGATSNLITHASKGDTALSVTLTAISSVLTVFSIPFIMNWALAHFLGQDTTVQLPVLETIGKIMVITVIPVSIGMLIRRQTLNFAIKMERPVRLASVVIFTLIVLSIIVSKWQLISDNIADLSSSTLTLNVVTMFLGFSIAMILRLKITQAISISIESGIQNSTLAIVIATTIIKNEAFLLPAGIYSLFMFITGGIMILISHNMLKHYKSSQEDRFV